MSDDGSNPELNGSPRKTAGTAASTAGEAVATSRSAEAYDRLLLQRLRASDPEALDELVARTWDALVSYAERIVGSLDAAEDVAQESFVRLWAGRRSWDAGSSGRAVLHRITRNLALDERRKGAVRERSADVEPTPRAARTPTPLELAEATELRQALEAALAALSDRDREIFTLSRFHGLSPSEIAKVLDLAPQTVSNLLNRILNALRRRLSPFLADSADPKVLRLPRRRA